MQIMKAKGYLDNKLQTNLLSVFKNKWTDISYIEQNLFKDCELFQTKVLCLCVFYNKTFICDCIIDEMIFKLVDNC